jgi:hypothetical protein
MASIFVSYRRDDAAGFAGRVEDELERRFGDVEVFRDVDDIASGEDFVRRLDRALQSCRVFVAVIGRSWLTARNADGTRRLDDPNDFVRQEISAALGRDVRVIPVLVDGARMPAEADLPQGLKSLARRQAHELSDSRWDYDMGRLASSVEETLGPQAKRKPANRRRLLSAAAVVVVLLIAGVAGRQYFSGPPDLDGTWDLPNGSYWVVEQAGRDLTIQEVHYDSREVWKKGQGSIDGDSVEFRLDLVFQEGYYTEGRLSLSADRRRLNGVAVTRPRNTQADVVLTKR